MATNQRELQINRTETISSINGINWNIYGTCLPYQSCARQKVTRHFYALSKRCVSVIFHLTIAGQRAGRGTKQVH